MQEKICRFPAIPSFSVKGRYLTNEKVILPSWDDALLLVAKEHETEILLDNGLFALKPGEVLLVRPFSHCFVASEKSFCGYRLAFSPFLLDYFGKDLLKSCANAQPKFVLANEGKERLFELLGVFCFSEKSATYKDVLSLFAILDKRMFPVLEDINSIPYPLLLNRILSYLFTQNRYPISTDEIAKRYDTSKSTVLRLFKNHLAITPNHFIKQLRLQNVKTELLQGKNENEVMEKYAFSSTKAWNKAFSAFYKEKHQ